MPEELTTPEFTGDDVAAFLAAEREALDSYDYEG